MLYSSSSCPPKDCIESVYPSPHLLSPGVQISVKTLTGKIITLEVDPSDTMGRIVAIIKDKAGVRPGSIRLKFGDQQLDYWQKLSYYSIQEGATLDMCLTSGMFMSDAYGRLSRKLGKLLSFSGYS